MKLEIDELFELLLQRVQSLRYYTKEFNYYVNYTKQYNERIEKINDVIDEIKNRICYKEEK